MTKNDTNGWLVIILAAVSGVGYIMNIVKMLSVLEEPLTAFFIARIVGVPIIPLGAILGWF